MLFGPLQHPLEVTWRKLADYHFAGLDCDGDPIAGLDAVKVWDPVLLHVMDHDADAIDPRDVWHGAQENTWGQPPQLGLRPLCGLWADPGVKHLVASLPICPLSCYFWWALEDLNL